MRRPTFSPSLACAQGLDGRLKKIADSKTLAIAYRTDAAPFSFVDEQKQPVATKDEAFQYRPGDSDTAVRSIFNIRINPEATAWDVGAGLRWLLDTDVIAVETCPFLTLPPSRDGYWKTLKLGMRNEYTSQPPADTERLDTFYFLNVVLEFK